MAESCIKESSCSASDVPRAVTGIMVFRVVFTAPAVSPSIANTSTERRPPSAAARAQTHPAKDLAQRDLRRVSLIGVLGAIDHPETKMGGSSLKQTA